jgi:RNA polymerase sigma-70 factor (ECF subfamily)
MSSPNILIGSAPRLAQRIERGDPGAEDELARAYRPRVLALLSARTHDREAAYELCSDVLMAVLRALRVGRLRDHDRLSGFVLGTARNVANNYLRARRRMPVSEPLSDEVAQDQAPDLLERRETQQALQRELGRLSVIDRRILALTVVDGLKPAEAARELGMSAEVVRARKSRALKRLAAGRRSG